MITFCKNCADKEMETWRGWPGKNPIPLLPISTHGNCPSCGCVSGQTISNEKISWSNIHSSHSTGLPDYWILEVIEDKSLHWGHPYLDITNCPSCSSPSVLSEINYPTGKKFFHNCPACRIVNI